MSAYLRTVLRHEISHAMGLGHSGDCTTLLGCPNPPAGRTCTAHDLAALQNFCLAHPLD
ncbi:MAG: hypothetical protein ACRD0F_05970 [Acidimicrobiales bacterium]